MIKDQEYATVDRDYLMELEEKAKDSEYLRGRIDGMEYVVEALVAERRKRNERR